MKTSSPNTGRINLSLKTDTIHSLRLLALLKGRSQNVIVEDLLSKAGLGFAVEEALKNVKPKKTIWDTVRRTEAMLAELQAEETPIRDADYGLELPDPPMPPQLSAPVTAGADSDDDIPW